MKIFPHPLLRRLARDLAALCRLLDMMVAENERQNGRAKARQLRRERAQKPDQPPIPEEVDYDWPE